MHVHPGPPISNIPQADTALRTHPATAHNRTRPSFQCNAQRHNAAAAPADTIAADAASRTAVAANTAAPASIPATAAAAARRAWLCAMMQHRAVSAQQCPRPVPQRTYRRPQVTSCSRCGGKQGRRTPLQPPQRRIAAATAATAAVVAGAAASSTIQTGRCTQPGVNRSSEVRWG